MTTYISKALRREFPDVALKLNFHLDCRELDTPNIWARDFMPVKIGDKFFKFKYKGYEGFPQLEVKDDCWMWTNPKLSYIYLDGGNVEQNDTTVLMTEIVFKNNPDIIRKDLEQFLKDIFQKKIIFVPVEPGDELGHIDGIARFINEDTVFINDYRSVVSQTWIEYAMKLEKVLTDNGLKFVKLPWAYFKMPKMTEVQFRTKYPYADDYNPGVGYYINFYRNNSLLFAPTFGFEEDETALLMLKEHFGNDEIIPIDCFDLSMLGGLLNCCTWEE